MKIPYAFSVLRYVHDPVTSEFANVGVALYAPEARYLGAMCTAHYARLSKMFSQIDGDHFRQISKYIEGELQQLGRKLQTELQLSQPPSAIEDILKQVLPQDDSSFQFSTIGAGLTTDPDTTLRQLYDRYVEKYSGRVQYPSRDDEEVWTVFKRPLEEKHVTAWLRPKRITAPDYEYEFKRARKNEVWHAYEPISFDLMEAGSILEKANNWMGRLTNLAESTEEFKPHLLLGAPHDPKLQTAFTKAQNILYKTHFRPQLVRESEAEEFAESLSQEIRHYGS
jgi:hypothetical protein